MAIYAFYILDIVLYNQVDEDHLGHSLNHELTRIGMWPVTTWEYAVLELREIKFAGLAFFSHAFPARGIRIARVKVQV